MKSSENNEENVITKTNDLTEDKSSSSFEKEWEPKDPNNLTKEEKTFLFLKQKDILIYMLERQYFLQKEM